MDTPSTPPPVSVPILVGVTGKRKSRLDKLGVSEALVRTKLRQAFALVQKLAPNSPKLLLCGMADGVDEIAARLMIEAVDEQNPGQREFHDWSIVGLLPMPEEAFLDDFASGQWWYRALPEKQRKLIRLMPLQTLAKPSPCGGDSSYTAEDLRRPQGGSNPARTAHYEQLGMVLAERSTVLIAVMPEDEKPERPGGTARVVAHRLNGWRAGWPPPDSRHIAARSAELVVPGPLTTPVADDVCLVPIGSPRGDADTVDLRVRRPPKEFPSDEEEPSRWKVLLATLSRWWQGDPEVLISRGRLRLKAARRSCRLLRRLDEFNRRAREIAGCPPPDWDETIKAHPAEPDKWSQPAATYRLRRTLSDIQRDRKAKVVQTAKRLAWVAAVSIFLLEIYAELFHTEWEQLLPAWPYHYIALAAEVLLRAVPLGYVLLLGLAIGLYGWAVSHFWPIIAEDYRLAAEALRVQVAWWRTGLLTREDRVDNFLLRYDTGAFQLLRRGLTTVLDAAGFLHAKLPGAGGDLVLEPALAWIREQIDYHKRTERERRHRFGRWQFIAWMLFGLSLGAAFWLAGYALGDFLGQIDTAKDQISDTVWAWAVALVLALLSLLLLGFLRAEDRRSPERAFRVLRIVLAGVAGVLAGAALVVLWAILGWPPDGLRTTLFLASIILLAGGGLVLYWTEKVALEAEAQGSETALPIYRRAEAALAEIGRQGFSPDEARRRREQIIRDLGEFALTETEAWLRSHRERPLHPALG